MNLILNSRNLLSKKIINILFNFNDVKINISQTNCFSKKLINNINDVDIEFVDLLNKIKTFLDNYSDDNTEIIKNIEIFNKLYLLYFKGGIIVNGNIL